ncbi:sodium ion-translocating decarboxylase subunit beta [Oscillospiraceae bacterium MB08-C2-2]|nr:sodium ion-translocating decarboxylase subunit beta [Oscillospiraceae bacterium MB08-C2-2]
MELLSQLFTGMEALTWRELVMYAVGLVLIWLAVKKDYEPMLLLPIGFGAILVNLPFATAWSTVHAGVESAGFLKTFYDAGIITELFPILIFIGVGAMVDFTPLLKMPKMLFFGAAAQFGIFFTVLVALVLGHYFPHLNITLEVAASIGVIGTADGPTSIVVAQRFAKEYMGPIMVAAYSYMSLVPIIQPPVIKALTTKKERLIRMDYKENSISKLALVTFPIAVTILAGVLAPESASLVGSLMFGNLIRECGVLERLSKTAQNELANLVTLVLGITIGSTMKAQAFLQGQTMLILALGLVAFIFDTAGGVLFAKLLNVFSKEKVNPMIGAAGISAFPMSSRIVQRMAKDEDPTNFILMQAVSANVSGQVGSVIAGGMILHLVPLLNEMLIK